MVSSISKQLPDQDRNNRSNNKASFHLFPSMMDGLWDKSAAVVIGWHFKGLV